jgi:hypothetical protein
LSNNLDPIQGEVTVLGGSFESGTDTLTINDSGSTTPHVYTQTPTTLQRSGAAKINFFDIDILHIFKGPITGSPPLATNVSLPKSIKAGQAARLTGHLSEADGDTKLTLTVDWGDGSQPTPIKPGQKPFSLAHKYAAAGTYTVRAIWTDSTGQSNFQAMSLSVTPKPPKQGLAHAVKAHHGLRR